MSAEQEAAERDELLEDAFRVATGQSMMLATNEMLRAVIASHASTMAELHQYREPPCICWNCVFDRSGGREFRASTPHPTPRP